MAARQKTRLPRDADPAADVGFDALGYQTLIEFAQGTISVAVALPESGLS
jgi:hypothetical protein